MLVALFTKHNNTYLHTMKKLVLIALFGLLVLPGTFAQAREDHEQNENSIQPVPTRQNLIQQRIENQRKNYVLNLKEAREVAKEYRAADDEAKKELREKTRAGFMVRLTNAVEKLSDMQDRVETRITSTKDQYPDFDATSAEKYLSESRQELEYVLEAQDKIKTLLENTEESEKDTIKEEIRTIFDQLKTDFKDSRQALHESIRSLKEFSTSLRESHKETEIEDETELEIESHDSEHDSDDDHESHDDEHDLNDDHSSTDEHNESE